MKSFFIFWQPYSLFLSLSLARTRTRIYTSRSITVAGLYLFFPLFRDISLFTILFSSSPLFPILAVFAFVFRSLCRSHLLVDISSFSPPYLRPFQSRPLFVLFLSLSLSTCAALGYDGILFSCNLLTTFQRRKVMCTGYPTLYT